MDTRAEYAAAVRMLSRIRLQAKKNLPFGSLLHLSPGNHGLLLKLNSLNKGWLTAGLVVITHLLTAYGKNHYPVHAGGRLLFRVVFGCCV